MGFKSFPSRVVAAAERIGLAAEGRLDLERLSQEGYSKIICQLKDFDGIADKIANCIALFGLDSTEAFPMDTWVQRAITYYYGQKDDPGEWARGYFGANAGYASQLLFRDALTRQAALVPSPVLSEKADKP